MKSFNIYARALTLSACLALAGCSTPFKISYNFDWGERDELHLAEDRAATLKIAREIIAGDPFMTLVTVDQNGQPRARTVEHSVPDENMVIWISTIPGTRKLEQIKANPKVTLTFDNESETSYVTLMGKATIHTDLETIQKKAWRSDQQRALFWPDFPENYVLIKVEPKWIEVVAPSISSDEENWRPQAVTFD